MKNQLVIHELTIAVAINNYDLTLCLPRFLQSSGIVPKNWALAQEPVANNQLMQTVYSNGVHIIGQPNRCLFAENLETKALSSCETPQVATSYVKVLPHLDYQAVGINLRGYFKLGKNADGDRQEFFDRLLISGSWQNRGTKAMEAELNFRYTFEDKILTLNINDGLLRQPENEAIPIILFGGNFAYDLSQESLEARVEKAQKIINNWEDDLQLFQDTIGDFAEIERETEQLEPALV